MNNIPKDPIMLLSWLNLKLRDFYPDLDSLCDDLELDRKEIEEKMKAAGFEYSEEHRKFW
jgi:hypothetical protein